MISTVSGTNGSPNFTPSSAKLRTHKLNSARGGGTLVFGKLCLTAEPLGSTQKGYSDIGQAVAEPCSSSNASNPYQEWLYSTEDPYRQLRSVAFPPATTSADSGKCLTAVPPVPLVEVAAAMASVTADPVYDGSVVSNIAGSDGQVHVDTSVRLQANVPFTFVVSVVSSRDAAATSGSNTGRSVADDAVSVASRLSSSPAAVDAARAAHALWWSQFWNASAVNLGPKRQTLEGFWYGMQYLSGMQNAPGKQASGLWGPFIQTDTMNWNGDYTLDYNFQSTYYGAFSSNRPSLVDNYFPVIIKALPLGRRRAQYPRWADRPGHSGPAGQIMSGYTNGDPTQGNYSGIELPSHVSAYGGYYFSDLGTRGIIGWVLLLFIDHYDYTQDLEFLRNTTYPILKEAGSFFENYLTYDAAAGVYNLKNACALEGCTTPKNHAANGMPQQNVAMTLGWIAATFKALGRFSIILGVDGDRRDAWQAYLSKLAPYPTTTYRNETVFDECDNSVRRLITTSTDILLCVNFSKSVCFIF